MTKLPPRYADLEKEGAPQMLVQALKLYGTLETPGSASNPTILAWADEVGGKVEEVFLADSIPWCGLFLAVVAKRAGWELVGSPLWALSWSGWGDAKKTPELGDVLTFTRKGGGHVGIYVGEDDSAYHVLGGNQSDAVTITRIAKSRLYAARTPRWRIAKPKNVRRIHRSATGSLSSNEA
jgi:uncharacterized protein (TIGR02594 family)